MKQTPEHILVLIEKYQDGTATIQEKLLLDEWYHSFDNETEIPVSEYASEHHLAMQIRTRLAETINNENGLITISRKRKWMLPAAAAIVLVLLAGLSWVLLNQPANQNNLSAAPVNSTPTNDIAPGGNKAILTLADGSTIILDSASNGILTQQGSIKVHKLGNGLLAYTINGRQVTENDEAFYNTITTPRGGQYHVTLSDGSRVWLNAASSIRFPVLFVGKERKVDITGEAYFEIASHEEKDHKKPFIVQVNPGTAHSEQVEVLGTHFNINAYHDENDIKTTLLEGSVKVSLPMENGQSLQSKFLTPGQQSAIGNTKKINIINNADTEEAVAWKNGRFQFKSADLNTILRQVSRWYDVDIVMKENVNLHFTGQLTRNANVSNLLEKLSLTGEVNFKIEGKQIIVSP